MEKQNLTQQKHAFTNQNKCTTTQNKHKTLKPGLVASYNIRPGNREGLFWFWRFINLSLTYLLRHLPTYLQPWTQNEAQEAWRVKSGHGGSCGSKPLSTRWWSAVNSPSWLQGRALAEINFNAFPSGRTCLVPPIFVTSESAIVSQGHNTVSDISNLPLLEEFQGLEGINFPSLEVCMQWCQIPFQSSISTVSKHQRKATDTINCPQITTHKMQTAHSHLGAQQLIAVKDFKTKDKVKASTWHSLSLI